jgi:hypothetical protein
MIRDVDRRWLRSYVLRRLADPSFCEGLTAVAPDGSRPVIVALRDDGMTDVLRELHARGGSGNLIVPHFNGYVIVAMTRLTGAPDEQHGSEPVALTTECTVGLFVERLKMDGSELYYFVGETDSHDFGTAEVVGLAG